MKQTRQSKIFEIINKYTIETQEQLIDKLNSEGFEVTQATISRDIRELRLMKVACGLGVYKYVVSTQDVKNNSVKFHNIMKETVISVDYAGNIVVIKTYAGMAQAAGAALDTMGWMEIVGSIAGDDTIILVMRSNENAKMFAIEFEEILNI